jgi:hypothetical protein
MTIQSHVITLCPLVIKASVIGCGHHGGGNRISQSRLLVVHRCLRGHKPSSTFGVHCDGDLQRPVWHIFSVFHRSVGCHLLRRGQCGKAALCCGKWRLRSRPSDSGQERGSKVKAFEVGFRWVRGRWLLGCSVRAGLRGNATPIVGLVGNRKHIVQESVTYVVFARAWKFPGVRISIRRRSQGS